MLDELVKLPYIEEFDFSWLFLLLEAITGTDLLLLRVDTCELTGHITHLISTIRSLRDKVVKLSGDCVLLEIFFRSIVVLGSKHLLFHELVLGPLGLHDLSWKLLCVLVVHRLTAALDIDCSVHHRLPFSYALLRMWCSWREVFGRSMNSHRGRHIGCTAWRDHVYSRCLAIARRGRRFKLLCTIHYINCCQLEHSTLLPFPRRVHGRSSLLRELADWTFLKSRAFSFQLHEADYDILRLSCLLCHLYGCLVSSFIVLIKWLNHIWLQIDSFLVIIIFQFHCRLR